MTDIDVVREWCKRCGMPEPSNNEILDLILLIDTRRANVRLAQRESAFDTLPDDYKVNYEKR